MESKIGRNFSTSRTTPNAPAISDSAYSAHQSIDKVQTPTAKSPSFPAIISPKLSKCSAYFFQTKASIATINYFMKKRGTETEQ